jgi:hypothetical protein
MSSKQLITPVSPEKNPALGFAQSLCCEAGKESIQTKKKPRPFGIWAKKSTP